MTEKMLVEDAEVLQLLKPKGTMMRGWLVAGFVGVAGLVGVGAIWGPGPAVYVTAPVGRGDLVQTVTAVGQLEAIESVEVGSDLSGKLVEVWVQENDRVEKGAVLARIDPVPFENIVRQARAQLAQARAQLAQAQVAQTAAEHKLARIQALIVKNAATEVELSDAKLALLDAKAAVDSAAASAELREAGLADAREDLKKTTITAPSTGVVMQRLVEPGQTVVSSMSATALFVLASDLRFLKAEVAVDEADVARVTPAQPVQFTVAAWPDRVFSARIAGVDLSPQESSDVVSYEAELKIDNQDESLRPGMTATADIEVGRLREAWLVPAQALQWGPEEKNSGKEIYLLIGGKPVAHPISVLGAEGGKVAIHADLPENAQVITGEVGGRP